MRGFLKSYHILRQGPSFAGPRGRNRKWNCDMIIFLQQLLTGISIGGVYALLAVGYALIYSIFEFTNFAFGAVLMVSAFSGYFATTLLKLDTLPSLLIAVIAGMLVSVIVELLAYRPLRKKNTSRLFLMISAIGVNIFLTNLATVTLGANIRMLPASLPIGAISIGQVHIGSLDIFALVASGLVLAALWIFLYKSRTGIAIRASAHDTSTSSLMGINVNKVSVIVFAISGISAGIAGMFFGLKYTVYPTMGIISTKAFIASVIGGLGSLPGAVLGALILGLLETMVAGYISSTFRDLFSFGTMILVLMFLPNGILGKNTKDKI